MDSTGTPISRAVCSLSIRLMSDIAFARKACSDMESSRIWYYEMK
jgi:hypothetical protein